MLTHILGSWLVIDVANLKTVVYTMPKLPTHQSSLSRRNCLLLAQVVATK
jgi:hypothetical protein